MRRYPFLRFFLLTLVGTALVLGVYLFVARRGTLSLEPHPDEYAGKSIDFPPPPMSGFQSTVPAAPIDADADSLPVPHPGKPGQMPAPPDLEHAAPATASSLPPMAQPGAPDLVPLAPPFPDLRPGDLQDTFNQGRGNHKHEAIDIMQPRGTPVHAVVEGNIAKLFNSKYGGLTIYQFNNTGTYCFYYAHLDRYDPSLKEGTLVRAGSVIGYVGSSGDANVNAPHLHFAIFKLGPQKHWWEGTPVDPYPSLMHAVNTGSH
jgi:murein DD-endopeptidase MepM/ murein hydrolase activator NlpD